jgi:hypothetical protein
VAFEQDVLEETRLLGANRPRERVWVGLPMAEGRAVTKQMARRYERASSRSGQPTFHQLSDPTSLL